VTFFAADAPADTESFEVNLSNASAGTVLRALGYPVDEDPFGEDAAEAFLARTVALDVIEPARLQVALVRLADLAIAARNHGSLVAWG
jgi:hypothetical protein